MNTSPPKGTRDFLPEDMLRRGYATQVIREVYESYGFLPLETPSYERLDTLLGKYGDEGDQLVFKILHRGQELVDGIRAASDHIAQPQAVIRGRSGESAPGAERILSDLGLRYDLTVPLARVIAEYSSKLPAVFKRYQIQPVWRADSPGKGRFREFFQCDLDVVGSDSALVEAEVLGAVSASLHRLGFVRFDLRLNHRALLAALMETFSIPPHLSGATIVALDKLDKLSLDEVAAELEKKGVERGARDQLLALVAARPDLAEVERRLSGQAQVAKAVADLRAVMTFAEQTGAREHLRFDLSLARGLGYYTGAIFEIAVEGLAGSLGGGGRYDGLVGMFSGKAVPACGASLGLERILVLMEERGLYPEKLQNLDLLLAVVEGVELKEGLALAEKLRAVGARVDLHPKPEKPGKLRQAADARRAPFAAWVERDRSLHLWDRKTPEVRDLPIELAALLEKLRAAPI